MNTQQWLRTALCGACMGAADIVPGISGGTVAFIMGFYEQLINSIKSFDRAAWGLLIRFRFKEFAQTTGFPFLSALVSGILFSLLALASTLHAILGHPVYRIYLYASFLGLIAASTLFCARHVKRWSFALGGAFLAGALTAYSLSGSALEMQTDLIQTAPGAWLGLRLAACGAIAVCAMLLPGISGSYLLTILGVFPLVIGALADLSAGLRQLTFDQDAFFILASMGTGIFLGALSFSHVVSWLMRHYHDVAVASLTGFMVGAIKSVWPFWSYRYAVDLMKWEKGPQLIPVEPIFPALDGVFVMALLCACLGFGFVFFIEYCAKRARGREPSHRLASDRGFPG